MALSEAQYFKKSTPALKKLLWKEFSLWIKLSNQVSEGVCQCYTCDKLIYIGTSGCHAGHWLSKKTYPFHYFNEDNVKPQCFNCNGPGQGMPIEFRRKLVSEYGSAFVEDMEDERHRKPNRDKAFYVDNIFKYRAKNKGMK